MVASVRCSVLERDVARGRSRSHRERPRCWPRKGLLPLRTLDRNQSSEEWTACAAWWMGGVGAGLWGWALCDAGFLLTLGTGEHRPGGQGGDFKLLSHPLTWEPVSGGLTEAGPAAACRRDGHIRIRVVSSHQLPGSVYCYVFPETGLCVPGLEAGALGHGWAGGAGVGWEGQGGGKEAGSLTWLESGAPLCPWMLSELTGWQWSCGGRGDLGTGGCVTCLLS